MSFNIANAFNNEFIYVALGFVLAAAVVKSYFDSKRRPPKRVYDSEEWEVEPELMQLKPRQTYALFHGPLFLMLLLASLFFCYSVVNSQSSAPLAEIVFTHVLGVIASIVLYFLILRVLKPEMLRQQFLLSQGDITRAKISTKRLIGLRRSIVRIQFEYQGSMKELEFFASRTHWKQGEYVTVVYDPNHIQNAIIYQDSMFRCQT